MKNAEHAKNAENGLVLRGLRVKRIDGMDRRIDGGERELSDGVTPASEPRSWPQISGGFA